MFAIPVLYAFWGLIQGVTAFSRPAWADPRIAIVVPKLKSDFANAKGVWASWDAGYPKEWGSEDFHHQFNEPDPEKYMYGVVTEDEKYLAMFNASHVRFIDLDANTTALTFNLGVPTGLIGTGLTVRSVPGGGYDVLSSGAVGVYDDASVTIRRRLSPDLKSIGDPTYYEGGIGSISKQGKLVTRYGYLYDLEARNSSSGELEGRPVVTDMSFSPDGVHLATVNWQTEAADLWNATSGKKIFQFPQTKAQNWDTRFSPDGKYVAITLGSSNNTVQIYSLDNLTAEPTYIRGFNYWPRSIEWSPDSSAIAVGDVGRMRIWKMPQAELWQTWEAEGSGNGFLELSGLAWLDKGKKITFMFREGRYMYDFQRNTKWWWIPRATDHTWGGGDIFFLSKKGLVATKDGDDLVRFWKI